MAKQQPTLQPGIRRPLTPLPALSTAVEYLFTESSPDNYLQRLNEKQLARRWGVSVRTLQAARVKGSGVQFIRIGRAVRYRLEDVLAYEEARLRTNTSETV
jgi:hypothetical protein